MKSNDLATNVNRFGQSVSELQTVVLRPNNRATDNIKIKRNFKKKGFVRKSNSSASNKQLW